jgi:hypothetical protein
VNIAVNLLLRLMIQLPEKKPATFLKEIANTIQKVFAFLLANMEEKEKKDKPIGYFKVNDEFIKELDLILKINWVVEKYRKIIIDEFLKLIKSSIVKK